MTAFRRRRQEVCGPTLTGSQRVTVFPPQVARVGVMSLFSCRVCPTPQTLHCSQLPPTQAMAATASAGIASRPGPCVAARGARALTAASAPHCRGNGRCPGGAKKNLKRQAAGAPRARSVVTRVVTGGSGTGKVGPGIRCPPRHRYALCTLVSCVKRRPMTWRR